MHELKITGHGTTQPSDNRIVLLVRNISAQA
jgi:hypothetical protein